MQSSILSTQTYVSVLVAVLAAVAAVSWWLINFGRRSIPSPWAIPLVGDTFTNIALGPAVLGRERHKQFGTVYKSWFVGEQVIHIGDADAVHKILHAEHDLVEASWPFTINKLIGRKGLSQMTGQSHAHTRKMIAPAFTPKANQRYIPRMVEIAQELCAEWAEAKHVKGEDAMKAYTFQVATELIVGFGRDFVTKELLSRQQKLWRTWVAGFVALPVNLPGFAFHKALRARTTLMNEYEDHILALIDTIDKNEAGRVQASMQNVIQVVKSDGNGELDLELLKDTAFTLLFAGHDTGASTLMMLLRFLKQRPATLQRLRAEQQQIVESYGGSINAESVKLMRYAEAAVKEAMRMQPIVPIAPRVALKSFDVCGYTIPKGHKLQLELWKVIEEDQRWMGLSGDFAHDVFNPDRWMTEEGGKAGAWVPFGAGPRMCVGYNLALLEIKILLAVLARSYDWQIDVNEPVETFPLPRPVWGLPMTFTAAKATGVASR